MNEKIRQLAEQCTSIPNHLNPPVFDQEKFARLIVRECVDIANNVHMCRDGRVVAEDIKEHFGVEE
jgi:hypothetical protein